MQMTGVVDLPLAPADPLLMRIPAVRGFVVRFPSGNAQSIRTFWEKYSESRTAMKTFRHISRTGTPKQAERYFDDHEEMINSSKPMGKVAQGMRAYRQTIDGFVNDPDLTQRPSISCTWI